MDEDKTEEETGEEQSTEDTGEGDKYETTPIIERAREEREKLEAATKTQKEENDRTEQIMAKKTLGGDSEAGSVPEKQKELTDTEYAEALERGEVNPLKEDGII